MRPYLIDIRQSDEIADVARKCNHNFHYLANVSPSAGGGVNGSISDLSNRITDLSDDIASDIQAINTNISELQTAMETLIDSKVSQASASLKNELTPPVNAVVLGYDPTSMYPGTTWSKQQVMLVDGNATELSDASNVRTTAYTRTA